ncbi:MAG: arylsulfatase [Planctomycetes bacterium]|nr:arylsulfatase [Planctomycetota bacterium]
MTLLHRALLCCLLSIPLAAVPARGQQETAPSDRAALPNIVLIYTDDVGYGDVGCYGATAVETPNVDRLAQEGLRFTDAHCSSATCTPSRYSLLTGEYAFRRRGTGVLPGNAKLIIEPGRTTLPEILHRAGYRTAVVGKWHLGLGAGDCDWNGEVKPGPLEVGFDECLLLPATGDRVPCVYVEGHRVVGLDPADPIAVSYGKRIGDAPTGAERPDLLKMRWDFGHDQTIVNGVSRIGYMTGGEAARWVDEDMADVFVARALRFIEESRERPFFLYFATHDIHVPRLPHERFVGKTDMGPRGDAIVEMDWCVGALLEQLDRLGLTERTLVIYSSDNGPVVNDGYRDEAVARLGDHRPCGPWRGGKYSAFEAGTRVPFIVRWPGRVEPGVSDALVSQVDACASLAALCGQPLADADAPDSLDQLATWLGESATGRDHVIEQAGVLSLRVGNWKLIEPSRRARRDQATATELGNAPEPQLYDLTADPGERDDRAASEPERAAAMAARLAALREAGRTRPSR